MHGKVEKLLERMAVLFKQFHSAGGWNCYSKALPPLQKQEMWGLKGWWEVSSLKVLPEKDPWCTGGGLGISSEPWFFDAVFMPLMPLECEISSDLRSKA